MVFGVQCKRVYSLGDEGTLDPYTKTKYAG